jgi:hypothetical protein
MASFRLSIPLSVSPSWVRFTCATRTEHSHVCSLFRSSSDYGAAFIVLWQAAWLGNTSSYYLPKGWSTKEVYLCYHLTELLLKRNFPFIMERRIVTADYKFLLQQFKVLLKVNLRTPKVGESNFIYIGMEAMVFLLKDSRISSSCPSHNRSCVAQRSTFLSIL